MAFPKINDMLAEVKAEFDTGMFTTMEECLNAYIRKKKYWPMIQTKKFFGQSGLVLLHNTYKRTDIDHFKELYEEVRSVVLDLSAPAGENIVVCLADKIPDRLTSDEYKQIQKNTDICEECYEGTMVYVYNHNGQWFFSTSTCPSVDGSRFSHPTKTHGKMFDEALQVMYNNSEAAVSSAVLREFFTSKLDPQYSYGFLLVHHENVNVMDYTDFFKTSDYAVLFHIFTRNKITKEPIDYNLSDLAVKYPLRFTNPESALEELVNQPMYGILVKTTDNVLKVSIPDIIQAEKENTGNANPWINMLAVYMKQNPEFKVNDYIDKYYFDKKDSLIYYDGKGNEMVPVYIIHTVMMTLKMMLHSFYCSTTIYNTETKKYTMDKALDEQFSPIIRFHLAQLRNIQVTSHRHATITAQTVYHYLCLHQTMKNMRLLIHHVAKGNYNLSYRTDACFKCLANVL